MLWVQKYAPKNSAEVVGQQAALSSLRAFLSGFGLGKGRRAALCHGPVGCGKTSAVYALAQELGYEVFEVNASDTRSADSIASVLGPASRQRSLFGARKILLVDELDGIEGHSDRGGVPALKGIIGETRFPVVMTANDPWDKRFSELRRCSVLLQFSGLQSYAVFHALKRVAAAEGIACGSDALFALAQHSNGDLRGALNDFQLLAEQDRSLKAEDVGLLGERFREESLLDAMQKVFSSDVSSAASAFWNVDERLEEGLLWVEENLPRALAGPEERAEALEHLSRADVFMGRVRKRQHYRFQAYASLLATAGVSSARTSPAPRVAFQRPQRLLKLWMARGRSQMRRSIAEKLAEGMNCSARRASSQIPYLRFIFQNNRLRARSLSESLQLSPEEADWLGR